MHVVNKKILMKENILITGCGGYLGSYLIPYLYKKNYKITGYDIGFFKKCNLYKNQLLNKLIGYVKNNYSLINKYNSSKLKISSQNKNIVLK